MRGNHTVAGCFRRLFRLELGIRHTQGRSVCPARPAVELAIRDTLEAQNITPFSEVPPKRNSTILAVSGKVFP